YWAAIVYLNRAILLRELEAYRWVWLGHLHRVLENEAAALQATRKALECEANNLIALDERAAILANIGDFAVALETIEKRLKQEPNPWLSDVKAYVLIYQEQYEDALELLNRTVETGDDLWNHNLRAICYLKLDEALSAQKDFAWIWERHTDPAFAVIDNQSPFGWAAYNLALLSNQLDLLGQAINIFEELDRREAAQRVSGDLGACYLTRGQPGDIERGETYLEESIEQAINARELEGMLKYTLAFLEKRLSQWPHGEQVRAVLERVKPKIEARRDELEKARPRSAEEEIRQAEQELKKVVADPERKGPTDGWAELGARVELARLYTLQNRWLEAALIYRDLQASERFPEAHLGLGNAINGLLAEGNRVLKEGQPDKALAHFTSALSLVPESFADDKKSQADLYSRMGCAYFELQDLINARTHFFKAIELYREDSTSQPGEALGLVCRALLRNTGRYWALEEEWQAIEAETNDERLRGDLAVARVSLRKYLDELYQLSAQAGESTQMLPVVTPIAVEIGQRLIPEEAGSEWSLIKSYLPEMRDRIQNEMGVRVPGVRIRGNETDLPLDSYLIILDEVPIVMGYVEVTRRYCVASPETLQGLGIPDEALIESSHPLTGELGCWLEPDYWELVTSKGFELWAEPLVYMIYHLEAVLRRNLADFLGVQEVENLIESWEQTEKGEALS
ncbi:MAG: FHIPEP family type III secretion protein, partial [Acidobacteria bacterium]|nr:FHIPEP family type III secretion protein [Acidobacteriota bacterium]